MNMKKRFFKSIALLFLIAFLLVSAIIPAGAVTFVTYDDYKYAKIADFKVYVASYTGTESKYYFTVPAKPSTRVSTVGVYQGFMKGNTNLKTIELPDSVEEIMGLAFRGCTSLSTIALPVNLKTMGDNAFENSGIKSIKFNAKLNTIGESVFAGCKNLTTVTLPDSVTSVGRGAFSNCPNLKFATVPATVTSISPGAFLNCNENFIMYGDKHTAAERYAKDNNITFIANDSYYYGDVNNDGEVSIKDVTYLQKCLAHFSGFSLDKDAEMRKRADVNGDGEEDVSDAVLIQKYVNYAITKFPVEM